MPRVFTLVLFIGECCASSQTGSGKTYTMEGPVNADEHTQGMIPRALQQVFTSSRDLNEKGWVVS